MLCLIAAAALAAPLPAAAPGGVSGAVVETGRSGAGLAVVLLDATGAVVARATPDAAGMFRFTGLKPGRYVLLAENPNTGRVGRADLVVRAGRETAADLALFLP